MSTDDAFENDVCLCREAGLAKLSGALSDNERESASRLLGRLKMRLDTAGEMLAATHITHALDCLDPASPINRQVRHRAS